MARHASRHDFEGGDGSTRRTLTLRGEIVDRPTHLYDQYRRFDYFAQRADWIKDHYPEAKTILVAGCGWGFLVEEIGKRGIDAWGIDASGYAVAKAQEVLGPHAARRVLRRDAGDEHGLMSAAVQPGVSRFDLVVTEDLLPSADDAAEARRWLENLRLFAVEMLHICTPKSDHNAADLLWKTHAEWAAFCAPDPVLCTECMRVLD